MAIVQTQGASSVSNTAIQASPRPLALAALDNLDGVITTLDCNITALAGKLDPVLAPSESSGNDARGIADPTSVSLVRERLNTLTRTVEGLNDYLNDIKDRLEV